MERAVCPACAQKGVSFLAAFFSNASLFQARCNKCGAKVYLKVKSSWYILSEVFGGTLATLALMAAFSGSSLLLSGLGFLFGAFLWAYPLFFASLVVKEPGSQ
jgi:hypothetical protein